MLSSQPVLGPDHLDRVIRAVASFASLPAIATQDWCERAAAALVALHTGSSVVVSIGVFTPVGEVVNLEATGGAPNLDEHTLARTRTESLGWWLPAQPTDRGGIRCKIMSLTPDHKRWITSSAGTAWTRYGVTDVVVALAQLHHSNSNRMIAVEIGLPAGASFDAGRLAIVLTSLMGELARRAAIAFGSEPIDPLNRITPREQEVLERLAQGKTVREIADELSRSPHTVHDHVKSLHRKLHASSRGELVARALGHIAARSAKPRHDDPEGAFRSPAGNGSLALAGVA